MMTRFPVLPIALVSLSACAFGTRNVNLVYGDRVTTNVAAPGSRSTVAVARFVDQRTPDEKSRLGWIRNTYGIPTAPVHAKQDPVLWVSDGVARALESRGYRVQRVETAAAESVPTITGAVTRVYSGMYANIDAHVEASVAIQKGGQTIFSTTCNGTAEAPSGLVSASNYEAVFGSAMDQFIADCIPRLVEPLEEAE
jgi:hypothetical protein